VVWRKLGNVVPGYKPDLWWPREFRRHLSPMPSTCWSRYLGPVRG